MLKLALALCLALTHPAPAIVPSRRRYIYVFLTKKRLSSLIDHRRRIALVSW